MDAQALPPVVNGIAKMLPPFSREQLDASFLQTVRDKQIPTASGFGLIVSRENMDVTQRIHAGQLWQRMHLWCTNEGIAMHPLNQMCERSDREISLGIEPEFTAIFDKWIGDSSWQPLMLFRYGYPTVEPGLSPRRAAKDVMV